jgi:hypothetical protein
MKKYNISEAQYVVMEEQVIAISARKLSVDLRWATVIRWK